MKFKQYPLEEKLKNSSMLYYYLLKFLLCLTLISAGRTLLYKFTLKLIAFLVYCIIVLFSQGAILWISVWATQNFYLFIV